ncbi:cob(I)yrinic acid a,c-diamide adenosyltransferase [Kordiimonas sp. SCSIO 12610]|uniref:cob(I)yrinic acid a,c-diamide adenosyltransferase n=1 Tax=Kordiimonas sp. SCSIO 12610 TaxID=2829597 RepID=UPI00210BFA53|nr:cob(I)yrinic acid a,c-diamide adenosyltransferase [Kordiimonas sp. SCSIO 12610]UTW55933.1 cob(I)yrinic acid a,c-diamide adenosyltransferase [Kordiimonas sp. SCSIO 12610]
MTDTTKPEISPEEAEAHKAEMKAQQEEHRAKMREKEKADRGLLLVNTGDGKGKSTAAFGTVIRALGWGWKVGIVQYIKGTWKTGEKEFFKRFDDLVTMKAMGDGFTWDTQDKEQDIKSARKAWEESKTMMSSGEYGLVVLDELNIVLRNHYLSVDEVLEGLATRHVDTDVIVTGRTAPQELMDAADLVTEMTMIKHPFEAGIQAKPGIDY